MLTSVIVRIVDFVRRHRWSLIAAGILLVTAAAAYDFARFSINTDSEVLFLRICRASAPTRAVRCFSAKEFSVVVTAPTPENVDDATKRSQAALQS